MNVMESHIFDNLILILIADLSPAEKAGDDFRKRRRNFLENERPKTTRIKTRRNETEMRFNEYVGTRTDFSQLLKDDSNRKTKLSILCEVLH